LPDGKGTHWEAIGAARKNLGPNIIDCIDDRGWESSSALSVEVYMFENCNATAAPQISVCSADFVARKLVRKTIETICNDSHPAVRVGEISQLLDLLPVHLAQEVIESGIQPIAETRNETGVLLFQRITCLEGESPTRSSKADLSPRVLELAAESGQTTGIFDFVFRIIANDSGYEATFT
jgi:predicted regulator of amino acid metabolism with ACT domain